MTHAFICELAAEARQRYVRYRRLLRSGKLDPKTQRRMASPYHNRVVASHPLASDTGTSTGTGRDRGSLSTLVPGGHSPYRLGACAVYGLGWSYEVCWDIPISYSYYALWYW